MPPVAMCQLEVSTTIRWQNTILFRFGMCVWSHGKDISKSHLLKNSLFLQTRWGPGGSHVISVKGALAQTWKCYITPTWLNTTGVECIHMDTECYASLSDWWQTNNFCNQALSHNAQEQTVVKKYSSHVQWMDHSFPLKLREPLMTTQ